MSAVLDAWSRAGEGGRAYEMQKGPGEGPARVGTSSSCKNLSDEGKRSEFLWCSAHSLHFCCSPPDGGPSRRAGAVLDLRHLSVGGAGPGPWPSLSQCSAGAGPPPRKLGALLPIRGSAHFRLPGGPVQYYPSSRAFRGEAGPSVTTASQISFSPFHSCYLCPSQLLYLRVFPGLIQISESQSLFSRKPYQ